MRTTLALLTILLIAPSAVASDNEQSEGTCVVGVCYEILDRGFIANVVAYTPTGPQVAYAEITLEQGYVEVASRPGSRVFLASAYDAPDWGTTLNSGGPVTYTKQAELGVYYTAKGPVADRVGEVREQALRIYDAYGTIATVPLVAFVADPVEDSAPLLLPDQEELKQFLL